MPHYSFHLTDGRQILPNPKGLDLPGPAAAREEAVVLARDLKEGKILPGRTWEGWFVEVKDPHGRRVESVPIADMPEA